jgi:SPP1 family predicted phage head-tail adaptor
MIKAGSLDRLITIQRATIVENDLGEHINIWSDLHSINASIQYFRDIERWAASQISAESMARFVIRWGFFVKVTDRIIFEEKIWDIIGVKEIGRREGQELTAATSSD